MDSVMRDEKRPNIAIKKPTNHVVVSVISDVFIASSHSAIIELLLSKVIV
jgi:hypothetical protein